MKARPASFEKLSLDDGNELRAPELVGPALTATTSNGRVARLRAERAWVLVKYNHGAMPHTVYAVVNGFEAEIAKLQMRTG